eukprot:13146535-Ditylum_brightwellii.AAC.1
MTTVKVERQTYTLDGKESLDPNGNPILHPETIYRKELVEKACMEEVERRSRMSEKTLPMITSLVNHLEYLGATEFVVQ